MKTRPSWDILLQWLPWMSLKFDCKLSRSLHRRGHVYSTTMVSWITSVQFMAMATTVRTVVSNPTPGEKQSEIFMSAASTGSEPEDAWQNVFHSSFWVSLFCFVWAIPCVMHVCICVVFFLFFLQTLLHGRALFFRNASGGISIAECSCPPQTASDAMKASTARSVHTRNWYHRPGHFNGTFVSCVQGKFVCCL